MRISRRTATPGRDAAAQPTTHTAKTAVIAGVLLVGGLFLGAMLLAITTMSVGAGAQAGSVLINELVAKNQSTLNDLDGDSSDWFELHNPGGAPINIGGWTIEDDVDSWTFPDVSIPAGGYRVVFASDKDLVGNELHTTFKLGSSGETLTLRDDNGMQIDQLAFPALLADEAYGRSPQGAIGVLVDPTPWQGNTAVLPPAVTVSPSPRQFVGSQTVTLGAAGNAQIRYTTNGDTPNSGSMLYTGPFSISSNTQLRAVAIAGGQTGPEAGGIFLRIDNDSANFSSNLPIVVVSSTSSNLDSTRDSTITVIDNPDGRTALVGEASDTSAAGVRIRGASSDGFPKKQYKVELWDDWQQKASRDLDLGGLGAESDWVLYAPGRFDRAMIQNPFVHELYARAGLESSDHQFVELYLDDDGDGRVSANEYDGLYVLMESIKIGEERVDITKLDASDNSAPEVTGGYIFTIDWNDDCCVNITQSPAGSYLQIKRPKASDITNSQENYAEGYIDSFEDSLNRSFGAGNGVRNYLDVQSWIDDSLIQIMAKEIDTGRASNYFYKDRDGPIVKGPAWDFDRSLNSDDSRDDVCNSFGGLAVDIFNWWWYGDLWDMPEYRALFYARWHAFRDGPFSNSELTNLVDELEAEIAEAYEREDDRWGNTNGYGSRYGGTLQGEINALENWLICRVNYMDDQWDGGNSDVPSISNPGALSGTEGQSFSANISASDSDTIVYTATGLPLGLSIDELSGQITGTPLLGSAASYQSVVTVTDSDGAARSRTVTITIESIAPAQPQIILNEYNAVGGPDLLDNNGADAVFGRVAGNGGDWLELVTVADELDITGWTIEMYEVDDVAATITTTDTFEFSNQPLLRNLRAGTILTIAESAADDPSYDPAGGDWTITLQANNADGGAFFTAASQQNFDTNADGFFVVVKDDAGNVVMGPSGETEAWDDQNGGVSDRDVMVLCANPAPGVDRTNDYADGTQSTFSRPNTCPGFTQSFDQLRPVINAAPTVSDPGDQTTVTGLFVSLAVVASDGDGDAVTFDGVGLPTGLGINSSTGVISGTASTAGTFTPTITVSDPRGAASDVSFTWVVNIEPTITSPGEQLSDIGETVALSIAVDEPDAGDQLTWSATGLPPGLTANTLTGQVTGTPTFAGDFTVTLRTEDRQGGFDTSSFPWIINTPPTIAPIADRSNALGNFVALGVAANDADNDALSFSGEGLPPGLTVNPSLGSMSGTLTSAGTFNVIVTVVDERGSGASQSFVWTVEGENKSATVAASCFESMGRFDVTMVNPGPGSATFEVLVTGLPLRSRFVGSGGTIVETITGRPDGDYSISVIVAGQAILSASETVDCAGQVDPTPNEVVQTISCLSGNGRIDTNIVNVGDDTADYRIEFEGLSPRQRSVPAGDWWRQPITGRPDGDYGLLILRNGVAVLDTTITVACDAEPPVLTSPAVQIVNACRSGNGYVLIQFANNTGAPQGYVIEFDGAPNRSTSAFAYGASVRAVTGRPDGTYEMRIRTDGVLSHTIPITVDCDPLA